MKIKILLLLVLTTSSSIALTRITDQEYWSPVAKNTAKNALEAIRLYHAHDQDFAKINNDHDSKKVTSIKNGVSVLSGTNGMGNAFWLVSSTNAAPRYGEYIGAGNGLPPRFCMAVFDSEGEIFEFAATTNTVEDISSGVNASGVYMRFRKSGVPSYFTYVIFSQLGPCSENSEMFIPLGLSSVDSFYMTEEAVVKAELAVLVDGNGALAERLSKYYDVCELNKPMGMAWLYIGAVLGNDVCRYNLAFSKEHHGATEKEMFHFLPEEVECYVRRLDKNAGDVVAMYFLFKHYEFSGDSEKASKYADMLRNVGINELLFDAIK